MQLEQFIRSEAQGHWTLEVYGIAPGYLKVKIAPSGNREDAIEYWLIGNMLILDPQENPLPPATVTPSEWIGRETISVGAIAA